MRRYGIVAITITTVIAIVILIGGVVACAKDGTGSTAAASDDPSLYAKVVNLPDGRKVTCVIFDAGGNGGIGLSCDWVNAS